MEIGECEVCHFEPVEIRETGVTRPVKMCEVCRSTYVGNAHHAPANYDTATLITIAWGINYLADLIKKRTKNHGT